MAGTTNMISNWAGGGASTTLGAAQSLWGFQQQKKNKRPDYEIPSEIAANMTQAEMMAAQGLPAAQKQEYINNLQRSQSFAMNQAGSRKAGVAGLAAVNQQGVDASGKLLSMDAQARQANQQLAMQQRGIMADYKDQQFQLNKLNPYYEKTAQNQAMIGAGMQNISQGLQSSNAGYDWGREDRSPEEEDIDGKDSDNLEGLNSKRIGGFSNKRGLEQYNYNPNAVIDFQYGGEVPEGGTLKEVKARQYEKEDAAFGAVGQMGAIGGAIQGVTQMGNAIGRPIRDKNEEIDENTGQLKNYEAHKTIGGGMLNPLSALQTRASYKGGFGDISGKKYKQHLIDSAQPAFKESQRRKQAAEEAATKASYKSMLAESNPEKYGEGLAKSFVSGGLVGDKKLIEVEKKEVIKTPDNKVFVANAPSHKKGGKKILAESGTIIFSDDLKVPGLNITFAEKAKSLKGSPLKMNELFKAQEKYKKQKGLT